MKYATLLFAVCLMACGSSKQYTASVKYSAAPESGVLAVLATGFGKDKQASIKNAISNAFSTLLFRGVPGSQYELPMISNENEKKNDPVIKSLLESGYSTFLVDAKLVGETANVKKSDGKSGSMTENLITINCDALRRYLEQNKVIRKFGI